MTSLKFEYIWLDGNQPEPKLRSKTKVLNLNNYQGQLDGLPEWSFDGSSTQQADGHSSDCILRPVRVYADPSYADSYLVMCEVYNAEGKPHATNTRNQIEDQADFWFGFEQEYAIMKNGKPLGFPTDGFPSPQGPYYCAVGTGNVDGRDMVYEHLNLCLKAGIGITGVNAEVMLGQWEYQCFGKGGKKASDDLWVSRYLLHRVSEKYGVQIELHPKPVQGDWNGSGMHTNFSNAPMREQGGEELMKTICDALGKVHDDHMAVYGSNNDLRLTGLHETQHISKFSYGISDRGASIRIPISTAQDDWTGYLEDRRPASNADPYLIVQKIINTVDGAMKSMAVSV
ncbi:MAG: glutamine synthetase beta-grasp domain-containing protein [Bacteroidota bacterium]